ncbi:hypothetical protein Pan44_37400 [Caulifigura coniformis]|uniref:Uncharacterized protein n=1 Tax=Caulifigura coniformis TaxID=2527983 RepID=A0A517SHT4_9PLAN|nr:hypothetical protein [Caulifigura coniformis]QDT55694.1 hypothetical protein Pan44_37400 [Caulifigura coniformis]
MPVEQTFGVVTVVSRERVTSLLTIVAGDTYGEDAGQFVVVRVQDDSLPDLSSATLTFTAKHRFANAMISGTGVLVSQTSSGVEINVSIPSTETAKGRAYHGEGWLFDLQADFGEGVKRTIAGPSAPCRVLADQTC